MSATIEVDGMMCEDIRIGIAVRQAFTGAGLGVSWMYRRKGGGICMSFSSTVIEDAGGFQRFLDEWERVEEKLVDGRWVQTAIPMTGAAK